MVELDEKESGERRSLNVGHTTGHAIELTSGLSHGESVLFGMLLETRMAILAGVCEKAYGEQLLDLVEKAIALEPTAKMDFSNIEKDAEKARSDKKNIGDGTIRMAVAKSKGQWTDFALPFADYVTALKAVSR